MLVIFFVLVESPLVAGEVYTSMADMEVLLETEGELLLLLTFHRSRGSTNETN